VTTGAWRKAPALRFSQALPLIIPSALYVHSARVSHFDDAALVRQTPGRASIR
jgi:hypothetical protein